MQSVIAFVIFMCVCVQCLCKQRCTFSRHKKKLHSQTDKSINLYKIFIASVLHCKILTLPTHDIFYIQCISRHCVSHVTCICLPGQSTNWTRLICDLLLIVTLNSTLFVLAQCCGMHSNCFAYQLMIRRIIISFVPLLCAFWTREIVQVFDMQEKRKSCLIISYQGLNKQEMDVAYFCYQKG